ncbi:hypothetical protein LTR09_002631 [Extremus antarcticus]|uniref:Uncharacterized protein n=1 Tax=Extremus antarcticus TaxID=702011 RepID=A0AAJ0GES0_9PEZI|nr:hypothetical protein LTR09_002631 [Extremus antarcticus]
MRQALQDASSKLMYARVHMKLSELVSGEFFNQYIKTGNILMLSEGRAGTDHMFSLVDGILRIEVDKATFERMGLEGKPIPTAGRKHVKIRYAIELNLRLPSMVRGKKGFERILWAFKNVLDRSVTWLFYDLRSPTNISGPISTQQPLMKTIEVETQALSQVTVPQLPQISEQEDYDVAIELLEWVTLAAADSPRIRTQDTADSYLSRYQVPNIAGDAVEDVSTQDLARVRWHGFMPYQRVQDIYLAALRSSGDTWFAMNVYAFDGHAYTILENSHHTSTWEYMA